MSDAIIGADGKPRCPWAGESATALARYHDEVWGTRTTNESALFEALTLGVFQAGLSWRVVFGKRDAFRRAFHGFNVATVSKMTEHDVEQLVRDPSIIRSPDRRRPPTAWHSRRACNDAGGETVSDTAQIPGVPLRRADERLRLHAKRRRGQ